MSISFGDTVRLPSSHIGTVRFIGHTEFKKNIIFYGIHLKEPIGKNNGSYDSRKYFKCPNKHGIFTEKKNLEMVKKHCISASFHYNENVSLKNNIGKGVVKYIGLTQYDNYKNYFYGVLLHTNIKQKHMAEIANSDHIYCNIKHKNIYFDAADATLAIFVRQNQLISETNNKKKNRHPRRMKRSMTMIPQKKDILRKKIKSKNKPKLKAVKSLKQKQTNSKPKLKAIKSSTKSPKSAKINKKNKSNQSKSKSKKVHVKSSNSKVKQKQKAKKIQQNRKLRMIKSDLGQIRNNTPETKINITSSNEIATKFNGCDTPPIHVKKLNKKKRKLNKKRKSSDALKLKKSKSMKHETPAMTKNIQYKKHKKHKKRKNKTQSTHVTQSYENIINDMNNYNKYIDNKHYFYHLQFVRGHVIKTDAIQQRSIRNPPPQMVSHFSSQSRINQRKKRQLPSPPNVYTININRRPLGFFIETKQLNTIVQNMDGSHVSQQIEIVDNENKFNKVNAYISMISNTGVNLWQNNLIIGSQLLQIAEIDITGYAFSKIFQILSSHKLPFLIKLAAPTRDLDADNVYSPASPRSPTSPLYSDTDEKDFFMDVPRGRGQTIDETTFQRKKKFLIF